MKHINLLCGKNSEFLNVKAHSTRHYQLALNCIFHYLSFFDPNIFLSTFFLDTCNLYTSFFVRDHVLRPYKTTAKLPVSRIFADTLHPVRVLKWRRFYVIRAADSWRTQRCVPMNIHDHMATKPGQILKHLLCDTSRPYIPGWSHLHTS
jgi:hypothetical protein